MAANAPGNPAAGNPANAPLVAAILLSPWDGEIDMSTKQGAGLWSEGIKPLETKFSGLGKDLPRFLADVKNRVTKCRWNDLLRFNTRNLLTQYGEIPETEVIAAKIAREAIMPTTIAEARPKTNATMMYYFIYDSLGSAPQKKLSTKLQSTDEDGPYLLYLVLKQTYSATQASTFSIKAKFFQLDLKKYKWNVQALNQDVREKLCDLIAAGHASDETETIIALFRAYQTATNEEFLASIHFWKNEWNNGSLTSADALMDRADNKYSELRDLGSWGKRSAKDDQIVALTAQVTAMKGSHNGGKKTDQKNKDRKSLQKWKNDRSLSDRATLERNNKTYHWCTGPGHNKQGMWVIHKPGTCTDQRANVTAKGDATKNKQPLGYDKAALTTTLKQKGLSDDEIESKIEAIVAVMES